MMTQTLLMKGVSLIFALMVALTVALGVTVASAKPALATHNGTCHADCTTNGKSDCSYIEWDSGGISAICE
jgi:hypothetical protein